MYMYGLAASVFGSCRQWLTAWITVHLMVVLALIRGVSSGGGIFAAELDKWQLVVVKKLPSRALTRIWGRITRIHLAPWARTPLLGVFCAMFGVRAEEAERGSLREFSSLHSFFTRTLKEELRPICPEHSVVSPADGTVLHVGKVTDGEVKQVKGINYKLTNFLGENPLQDSVQHSPFDGTSQQNEIRFPRNDSVTNLFQRFPHLKPSRGNELYHAVVYLSIADYHHFHSPAEWNVQMRRHIVGELLSVAPWVVRQVPSLFALSERVLLGGYWEHGFFSLTAVGAYNVGSIEVDMDKELETNCSKHEDKRGSARKGEFCDRVFGFEGVPVHKGEHVGFFHLGSTVVLVFEAPASFEFVVRAGDRVKFGQPLGTVKTHPLQFYDE